MPSPEGPPVAPDAELCDDPSVVEALEEVARAEARAEAARARVLQLSREADAASSGQVDSINTADAEDIDGAVGESIADAEPAPARWARLRRRVLRRPGRNALAASAAVVLTCAALGSSGYVV